MTASLRGRAMIRDVGNVRATAAPGPFLVREATTEAEIDAAGAVVAAAYAVDELADERYRSMLRDAHDRAEHATLLVAVDDTGSVLGTVTYALAGRPYAEVSRPGEAEFRMLGVAPQGQGRGIGRALVQACLDRAASDGATAVAICTMTAMTSARRIYERLGFTRDPARDWSPVPGIELLGYVVPVRG
jgi:GNAT superfamily N-acetyltransferase